MERGRGESLGLSCSEQGLFLGSTPLLDNRSAIFALRRQQDLERVLSRGYGIEIELDGVMAGLGAVASALNARDLCRARIAAVHLRLPPLPDAFARLDMQLEDMSLTLDRIHKTAGAGDWDPAKHPRAGTAPNPGWFAPTSGGEDGIEPTLVADKTGDDGRLHLPPGERNDEIGDLLEWIANAKPEDVEAISGEISRLFYQYSDFADGAAFHQALIESLANPDAANRQRILDQYEPITHHDPSAVGTLVAEAGIITSLRVPGDAPEIAAPAAEAVSAVWKLGWAAPGAAICEALGADLPFGFKTIDNFSNGLATSIKSIDLRGATYQDTQRLFGRISRHVDDLADFDGGELGDIFIESSNITARTLKLATPKVDVTLAQRVAIDAATDYAKSRGITLLLVPF